MHQSAIANNRYNYTWLWLEVKITNVSIILSESNVLDSEWAIDLLVSQWSLFFSHTFINIQC